MLVQVNAKYYGNLVELSGILQKSLNFHSVLLV